MKPQHWITRPTLSALRELLNTLEENGWSPDQQVQVSQMANAPEVFTVDPVEVWLGEGAWPRMKVTA